MEKIKVVEWEPNDLILSFSDVLLSVPTNAENSQHPENICSNTKLLWQYYSIFFQVTRGS